MNTGSEERIMIAELERIIQAEEAKPEAERDQNLIDDCVKEIAEIKGVKAEFSEEEVAQITDSLIRTAEKTKKRKRFTRLVAGIAAMFVIVMGITACTVNPALIDWFKRFVRSPFGSIVDHETITFIVQGSTDEYNSIEELLTSNSIDVYYPTLLPKNVRLLSVEVFEENETTVLSFKFSSPEFRYTIQLNCHDDVWKQAPISELETEYFHFNVYSEEGYYIAYSEKDEHTYIIQSTNINDITLVVGGLRKEK